MTLEEAIGTLAAHRNRWFTATAEELEEARKVVRLQAPKAEWTQDLDGGWKIVGVNHEQA